MQNWRDLYEGDWRIPYLQALEVLMPAVPDALTPNDGLFDVGEHSAAVMDILEAAEYREMTLPPEALTAVEQLYEADPHAGTKEMLELARSLVAEPGTS